MKKKTIIMIGTAAAVCVLGAVGIATTPQNVIAPSAQVVQQKAASSPTRSADVNKQPLQVKAVENTPSPTATAKPTPSATPKPTANPTEKPQQKATSKQTAKPQEPKADVPKDTPQQEQPKQEVQTPQASAPPAPQPVAEPTPQPAPEIAPTPASTPAPPPQQQGLAECSCGATLGETEILAHMKQHALNGESHSYRTF